MVPLEDGSGNARGHRRTFCTVCVESYAVGWVPEDDECPVCGAALEAEPAMAVPPAAPELSGDAPQSTTAGLLAEQQNFLMGQLGEGGAGTGAEGLRRAAEEIALAMSEQVGDTSSRAASPEAIASLQRIIIEDERCSALHEVVLEVFLSEAAAAQPRMFFETQIAAFSVLPSLEGSEGGVAGGGGGGCGICSSSAGGWPIVFGDPAEGHLPFSNAKVLKGALTVLKRGGATSFAAKALRAQEAGAIAVVVEQTAEVWPFTMKDSAGECQKHKEGGGGGLTIPAVMLSREDALKLRSLVKNQEGLFPSHPESEAAAVADDYAACRSKDAEKGASGLSGAGDAAASSGGSGHTSTGGGGVGHGGGVQGDGIVRGALLAQPLDAHCPVCQEGYAGKPGAVVCRLPCRHLFHEECVLAWLRKRNTCPMCRFELPAADEAYEVGRFERQRESARDTAFLSWFS